MLCMLCSGRFSTCYQLARCPFPIKGGCFIHYSKVQYALRRTGSNPFALVTANARTNYNSEAKRGPLAMLHDFGVHQQCCMTSMENSNGSSTSSVTNLCNVALRKGYPIQEVRSQSRSLLLWVLRPLLSATLDCVNCSNTCILSRACSVITFAI